jgi:hypothetical protein
MANIPAVRSFEEQAAIASATGAVAAIENRMQLHHLPGRTA